MLRGEPSQTRALIDSSENEWKYTSGVIAFHADDAPTEEQQQQVMDDFERLAFAGLEPDQYDILWVRHTHEGNIELHMVTPRLELHSGKALNIAPPGHSAAFDALRDAWNHENGWARPDDPERQRLVSTPENTQNPLLAERKTAREDITNWLVQRVESGAVQNREDILESLAEIGEITRSGKDYISVKPEGFDRAIRLKGALYEEKFNADSIRELKQKMIEDSNQIQELQQQQLEKLVKSLGDTLTSELHTTQLDIRKTADYLAKITKDKTEELTAIQQSTLDQMSAKQAELMQSLDQSTKASQRALRWSWLKTTVPSLLALAVILSASWALIELKTRQFINLKAEVIQSQHTLDSLPKGVTFQQDSAGIQYFLVKKEPEVYKTKSGEWAIKLKK